LIISTAYLRFEGSNGDESLRRVAASALPIVESAAEAFFTELAYPRDPYVEVAPGSIRVWGRIKVGLAAFIAYGGLRQAADSFNKDGRAAATWIVEHLPSPLGVGPKQVLTHRRYTPAPTRLQRLFDSVEQGTLAADEATRRAEALFKESREDPILVTEATQMFALEVEPFADQVRRTNSRTRKPVPTVVRHDPIAARRLTVRRGKNGEVEFTEIV
jgi:hypothetical protein